MKLVISIIKTVVAKGFTFSRHRFLVLYVICSFYLFIYLLSNGIMSKLQVFGLVLLSFYYFVKSVTT